YPNCSCSLATISDLYKSFSLLIASIQLNQGLRLIFNYFVCRLKTTNLLSVIQNLKAYAISLLRLGIKNRYIRSLDRRFPVNNATLGSALGIGLLMFLHNINASNQQLAFQNLNYFATLAFVSTGNNDDFIITFDFQHRLYPRFLQ